MSLIPACDDNFKLIEKASGILAAHGLMQEAEDIQQEASVNGYELFTVLRLLKQYMTI